MPPSSPDYKTFDSFLGEACKRKFNKRPRHTKVYLKADSTKAEASLDNTMMCNACRRFQSRAERVKEAEGGFDRLKIVVDMLKNVCKKFQVNGAIFVEVMTFFVIVQRNSYIIFRALFFLRFSLYASFRLARIFAYNYSADNISSIYKRIFSSYNAAISSYALQYLLHFDSFHIRYQKFGLIGAAQKGKDLKCYLTWLFLNIFTS